jgi:hypothetical protein
MKNGANTTRDQKTGQYAHSNFDAVCVCGHDLGAHTAAVYQGERPCIVNDVVDGAEPCDCLKFRKTRKR